MEQVILQGVRVQSLIGVYEWEREAKRPLVLDLVLDCNLEAAGLSDNVNDTIDYAEVTACLSEIAEESEFRLLEALAEKMINALFQRFPVQSVNLKMTKPNILPNVDSVAIQFSRKRPQQ